MATKKSTTVDSAYKRKHTMIEEQKHPRKLVSIKDKNPKVDKSKLVSIKDRNPKVDKSKLVSIKDRNPNVDSAYKRKHTMVEKQQHSPKLVSIKDRDPYATYTTRKKK